MKAEIKQAFKYLDFEQIFKIAGGIAGGLMLIGMMKSGMDDIDNNVRMMKAGFVIFVSLFALITLALWQGGARDLINQKRRAAEQVEKNQQDFCLWSNDDIPTMTDKELAEFKASVTARNISKRAGRKLED